MACRSGLRTAILRAPFVQRGLDTELLLTEPCVAVLPVSLADQYRSAADLVFVPVTDLSPSEVIRCGPAPAAPARPSR